LTDELEKIWKEASMAQSRSYPGICLEGLSKDTKDPVKLTGVPVEIRTERFRSANPVGIEQLLYTFPHFTEIVKGYFIPIRCFLPL
jgi:hypothetical protein